MADDTSRPDTSAGVTQSGQRYAAFISYSHADEEIGDWLHRRLETYQVPSPLIGRAGPSGPIGRRLGKVFRDRTDLSAAHDLGNEIRRGLDQADALIVLCSPRSCRSRYVHEEIRYFKHLGRGTHIFAAILDGEPHAAGKPGKTAADECFPPALIYQLGGDGAISSQPEEIEPIAADFRDDKDGRENGGLKIIAGLLGVGLDELVQREQQAERQRQLRANGIATAMAVLALGALVAGGIAGWQRDEAQRSEARAVVEGQRAARGETAARAAQSLAERNAQEREIQRLIAQTNATEATQQRDVARSTLLRFFATRAWDKMAEGAPLAAARYALAGLRLRDATASREYEAALGAAMQSNAESLPPLTHSGKVKVASFSPDSRRVVTGSEDGAIKVWDAVDGRLIASFNGYGATQSVAFSPDGSRLVASVRDGMARVWSTADWHQVAEMPSAGSTAQFSPDGRRIVTGGAGGPKIFDAESGALLASFTGGNSRVQSAAFSADGNRIFTSGEVAQIWDVHSGALLASLQGGPRAEVSLDGMHVVTSLGGMPVDVWDAAGARVGAIPVRQLNAAVSPNGRRVVTWRDEQRNFSAQVWDVAEHRVIATLNGHTDRIWSAAFSPEGQRVVTTSFDLTARIWSADDGALLSTLSGHTPTPEIVGRLSYRGFIESASFSPDGRRVVTVGNEGSARIWTANANRTARVFNAPVLLDAAYSPDGRRVATANGNGTVTIVDSVSGSVLLELQGHEERVRRVAFSTDGRRIVTASYDKTGMVWDANTGARITTLTGHDGVVFTASFSHDGRRVVTASGDGTAKVWDADSGRIILTLAGHLSEVSGAAFSPDGRHIVTSSWDRLAAVWDAATGRPVLALRGHEGAVMSAAFSPDGRRIVTASEDMTARVWSASTGQLIATLRGHASRLETAKFSPDGTRVVTGAEDHTAMVWDSEDGHRLATFGPLGSYVYGAAFSPDGHRILIASNATSNTEYFEESYGALIIWDVERLTQTTSQLARDACTRMLGLAGRQFSREEIDADPLLRSQWPDESRDVCEGVEGVAPLPAPVIQDAWGVVQSP